MKALVVGGGSIGKRHLENLARLDVDQLALVEPDAARRGKLIEELKIASFHDLQAGLEWDPDFVIVATPTHLHMEQALTVAAGGFDLFIEKPLSHDDSGVIELGHLVEQKRLISLVGCNLRFHPGPAKVKRLLSQERIGRILFARVYTGSYLPNWRPDADYRENYAAREETGGGCILDCIHEIDLARWYLGGICEVFCMAGQLSPLEIETEDVAALVCRHETGALSEIHLDYVQRPSQRGCHIVGESGSVTWDADDGRVRWYDANSDHWSFYPQPEGWCVNQMYLDELQHFIECTKRRSQTMLPIPEAREVLQVALASKSSAHNGKLVSLGKEVPA